MKLTEEIMDSVRRIGPVLHGKDPTVQGAILADLVAMWVVGHIAEDDAKKTEEYRGVVLEGFNSLVRNLMPVNDEMIREKLAALQASKVKH